MYIKHTNLAGQRIPTYLTARLHRDALLSPHESMTDLRAQLQGTLGAAYTLERELGGGGMSRVFLAEEMALGRKVVVKVLPPELTAGVNVDRFKREIQVAARLQHAHIVPVLTAGEMHGVPYYTMPFVQGESLRARIARAGPLPISEAIGVLRDVAKALAYAHAQGVVHRDIKPDNTMLSGGSASVVDFGIAKAISAARTDAPGATLTQIGTSIGTPAYMAPEQAAGDPSTDFRADLYAFGCTAYEALAGRPPFMATSPHKLLAAHMSEAPANIKTLRPDTPDTLASLIHRCLEKDPENRPEAASEIARQLDTITSGGELPVMPPILLGGPGMLKKALALYAAAFVVVAIVAKAAIVAIGLPEWVFAGSLIVMALGLPVILFTGYVHNTTRQLVSVTPQLTPGGSPSMPPGTMQTLAVKAGPHMSWRRTMLGGAYALGGFIVLVGGFMVMRALGIGPAGSLLAAGSMKTLEPLLVTDFTVTNADTSLGRVLSDAAKTQLAQSSVITLISPEGVADALRRAERPVTSNLDLPLARELAARNGVRVIVDGALTGLGANAGFLLTMKLVTADSARELASFRQTASTAQGLIEAVDQLARDLRGKVGESLKRVHAAPPLAYATTGSLEALRKYTQGERAENLYGRRAEAIAALTEAVTIDSTFAEAWRKLGVVLQNAGRPQAQRDSAFAAAYRHRMRVPEASRRWIVAAYFHNGPGRDRARAAEAYESSLRNGDSGIANNYAILLGTRRQFARAESLYATRIRQDPGVFRPTYTSLALTQRRQQKFAAADSTATEALKLFPDLKDQLFRSGVDALYRKGDTAAFRMTVDSMYTRGDSSAKAWGRSRTVSLMLLDGQLARWEAMAAQNRTPNPTPQQQLGWALNAYSTWGIAMWRKQPATVEKELDAALANFKGPLSPSQYLDAAARYAWAERPEKGRQMLARFEREVQDTASKRNLRPVFDDALMHVLIAEGKGQEAVAAARRADLLPDGPADNCVVCLPSALARSFDRAGVADSAIKYYEAYITTYDWEHFILDQSLLAQFNRRLGELYEQRGDREKASKYYSNFVNLWKNADAELQPQVAEVRRRLSRLTNTEPLPVPDR